MSTARRANLKSLATVYFALVIVLGDAAAAYLVLTDTSFWAVFRAIAAGGSPAHIVHDVWLFTRGTLLANPTLYLLLGLGVVAELTNIPLPRGGRMTAGFLIAFAALLMLGLPATLIVTAFAAITTARFRWKESWRTAFFNLGQYSLAYIAANAALTFYHVYIPGFPGPDDYGFVAIATLAFLVVNFLIVDCYIGLVRGVSPLRIVWEDDRTEIFVTLALAPGALLMATMEESQSWWGMSLVLIPLLATAYFVRMFLKLRQTSQELAEYNQQLTILQEVATRISSQIDLEQTLTLISQEIRRVVAYTDCMIFLLDEKSGMLVRQATADPFLPRTPLQLPVEHGIIGYVARSKEAVIKADLSEEALDVGALSGFRALMAVPIQTEKQVLGVLALLHREVDAFDGSDQRLLDILASQAAVAIRNAQLYRATQQLAVTDGLTGLYNRRYFEEQLSAELSRARRQEHVTSLIVLDVDHFKKFNDTHGHLLGDHVLQGVARVLQKSTRDTDLVARYGGEEFVVILPETPPEAALEVAERIRRNIKAHPFWGRGQTPLQVTASVGLASDPTSSLTPKALIDQADTSLYQAKKQGRDRVCRTIYVPDRPLEVTESRNDEAPEPTLRKPSRAMAGLSHEDWGRYLRGNLEPLVDSWLADPRVHEILGDAEPFWRRVASDVIQLLLRNLGSTEEERNAWLERFPRNPLYRPIQAELARQIQNGAAMTQMSHAILAFYKKMQAMIQGAPFSLEERMAVGSIQERLFHVMQLMVAQIWHDFYQATSEHLVLVSELEGRLSADFEPRAVLEEIARLTCRAMGADACLVLLPEGDQLVVAGAWGMPTADRGWAIAPSEGLTGLCYRNQEVLLVPDMALDQRLHRPFYERLVSARPVAAALMVPLSYQEHTLGVLFCMSERRDYFSPLDVRLGKDIGARLAAAMERQRQESERQGRYLESIGALAEALDARERTPRSAEKLMATAAALAGAFGLPEREIEALAQASRLHDIGELGIPDAVLNKPAPLTPEELALVRSHPLMGARILGYIEAMRDVVPIVRAHHERMDGSGYPAGLRGEEIPLLARILAVADAYEAMTSDRPYRQAMTPEQALYELRRSHQFDAEVVTRLEALVAERAR